MPDNSFMYFPNFWHDISLSFYNFVHNISLMYFSNFVRDISLSFPNFAHDISIRISDSKNSDDLTLTAMATDSV